MEVFLGFTLCTQYCFCCNTLETAINNEPFAVYNTVQVQHEQYKWSAQARYNVNPTIKISFFLAKKRAQAEPLDILISFLTKWKKMSPCENDRHMGSLNELSLKKRPFLI